MTFNEAEGNMYPWCDCTHTHHRGRCPHECQYCFVQHMRCARFYQGPLVLKESELKVNYYKYGRGKVIFVEHMTDLFAEGVPDKNISRVLAHCGEYPENTYVFQTKNPGRMLEWGGFVFPPRCFVGTTVETDRASLINEYSKAPHPYVRAHGLKMVKRAGIAAKTFLTVEPILDFDKRLLETILYAEPDWVNIGADSKRCGLIEPSWEKVAGLIDGLNAAGIRIEEKTNLDRLRSPS